MQLNAVIFDLDGVICFTDEFHYKAWKKVALKLGIPFDRTVNNRLRGVSRMESLEIILEEYKGPVLSQTQKNELAEEKNEIYRSYLTSMTPQDLPEKTKRTLEELKAKNIRMAIGSSSKNTPVILKQIGLEGFFEAVSDGNNITKSKPDPEVFLKAAEMLGVSPSECLVVEDALAGVEAGKAAGMTVACVGDASEKNAGGYNFKDISEILKLFCE